MTLKKLIDHTFLKPEATSKDIERLCQEAKTYQFYSVCVSPGFVALASNALSGSPVKIVSVVGFPEGTALTAEKVAEAKKAVQEGADEIDMVIHPQKLQEKDYAFVLRDIEAVVQSVRPTPVKVIIETSLLNEMQKIIACALSKAAGAQFVKTSTGFKGAGATEEDIRLMREVVGDDLGVKASGGIKTRDDAQRMVEAGANRLGTSSGVAIVSGESGKSSGSKEGSY